MKKKYIISLIISLAVVFTICFNPINIKADSGFDYSYDSGGSYSSYDSGSYSSYDSGSSYSSHDYSSSSDYGSSHSSSRGSNYNYTGVGKGADPLLLIYGLCMLLVIIVPYVILKAFVTDNPPRRTEVNHPLKLNKNRQISDEEIKQYISNFERIPFLRERYNDYKKIQEDWMNFNYDGLRENLTDELYNQYEMQLETLKTKKQKNIMKNITYKDSIITGISEENNQIKITVELIVSQIDYIEQNGIAVRGNPKVTATVHYKLTFVMAERPIKECPNCGAPLNDNATQKCEYCGSTVAKTGAKFILSKKEILKQL